MSAMVMEMSYERPNKEHNGLQIIRHPSYIPCPRLSSSWFDLRVFYVRVSNFVVDDSTTEFLTLHHIPLSPETLLEVNGSRCSLYSDGVFSVLRRDRMDKKSEEATFIGTDCLRLTGSVKFEVFDKGDLILSGILEMSNGFTGESKDNAKQWSMNCDSEMTSGSGFLKGKHILGPELLSPIVEVYVTGCFSGTPIILTKTLQLSHRKRHYRKGLLDAIPEDETTEHQKDIPSTHDWKMTEFGNYKPENEVDYLYWRRTEYIEGEDGDFSWFNSGVRVGVGIGLGVCVGLGLGVGLLVRSYQATTRNFKRRLV